jgi:cytochrome c peroxidase
MKAATAIAGLAALAIAGVVTLVGALMARDEPAPAFSDTERAAILAHGPWPPSFEPDPSNRVSGNAVAIALGRQLFFDARLSSDGKRSCATCHDPARAFSDGRDRSAGLARVDRNAIALANLRLNRWFGWSGAADSLWGQSIRPILDDKELGGTPERIRDLVASDGEMAAAYARVFGGVAAGEQPEQVLVNVAKALAAFQETIVTGRTAFDDFRDALERDDREAMARYPVAARRGLRIFVGKGQCSACHFGPNFTNGEFDDIGIPYFAEPGRVDQGRHGGIALLRASPFSLLGPYNDDPGRTTAAPSRHVEPQHRNWGEFRVPSLRNVAKTAPYMHNGSLPTLEAVVRHYSQVDIERLHGDDGTRLVRPLQLSPREIADLVAFLETLSSPVAAAK